MKKLVISIVLLSVVTVWSQETSNDEETEQFEQWVQHYYEGDHSTAYLGFKKFIERYPKSSLVPKAIFNQASLLRDLGKDDEAKVIFKKIMDSNFDEHESYGNIMEQYALYKNRSAKHLAEIYLDEKDFKNAAHYIYLFDKVYPYQHFCGNELSADGIYTDTMYAKMYYGKGKVEKAIKVLLPHMFYNGLAGNQEVLELLNQYLSELYCKVDLTALFKSSISNFKILGTNQGELEFLNVDIPVYDYQLYIMDDNYKDVQKNMTENERFKLLFKNHSVLSSYLK